MKKILLSCIPLLFIILSYFYFTANITSQLPNTTMMNYNLKSNKEPLTIADMEKLFNRISSIGVGFCCEIDEVKIKGETVSVVLVNENYLNVMNICKGEILKENVAIISDKLALKLFFSTKAENEELKFYDKTFKIADIYNESYGFINDISKDGKERIYIPYTCVENYKNINVDSIAYYDDSPTAPLIEQMDLSQYHSIDFFEKSKVIHTFEHILCFCLFASFCIIALKIWYLLCRKYFSKIKNNLKENYILKSIKSIPQNYVLIVLVGIGIPLILLVIFACSDFSIYIVSKYVPYDNIFDISHYINTIIENAKISNTIALTGNNSLSVLYSNTFNTLIWILAIFIFLFSVITYKILKKIKIPEDK